MPGTLFTKMTGSAGQKRVPKSYFAESAFPLPPLKEQKRIVSKVDRLISHCDRLAESLQEADSKREKLFAAVGHAVRALYMYAGMADIAALNGDLSYVNAIDRLWENVVSKKLYLTGGIGATGEHEGFGPNYYLPNDSAYAETCACCPSNIARFIPSVPGDLYRYLPKGMI